MPEPNRDDLLGRIESLERANRRWKRLALGLLAVLVLLVTEIGAFGVYIHVDQTARVRQLEQQVNQLLREAEAESERAEDNFQKARQAVDEAHDRLEP
jgi:hypothetical protein